MENLIALINNMVSVKTAYLDTSTITQRISREIPESTRAAKAPEGIQTDWNGTFNHSHPNGPRGHPRPRKHAMEPRTARRRTIRPRRPGTSQQRMEALRARIQQEVLMTTRLRCISVRQPWAWAILTGAKNIENRVARGVTKTGQLIRPISHTGLVGIHASQTISREGMLDVRIRALAKWLEGGPVDLDQLPTGQILGLAEIGACHLDTGICCGPWADRGVFHIPLTRVWQLAAPVPARGALGLPWTASYEVTREVWEQLGATASLCPNH